MQTYLSTINELLMQWYAIIMANPLYKAIFIAACVAAVLWFLMLVYYKIKVAGLRSKLRKAEVTHASESKQLNSELNILKEQLQHTAAELDVSNSHVAQLEADKIATRAIIERANHLEQSAKQLVTNLQTDFFLPALPEAHTADISQLLNHAIQNVAERLKTTQQQHLEVTQLRQQEQAALVEKESLVAELQNKIEAHVSQIQNLESDFKAQKSNWQQEQAQLHQELQLAQASQQDALSKAAEFAQAKSTLVVENINAAVTAVTHIQPAAVVESAIETVQHAAEPIEDAFESVVTHASEAAAEVEAVAEATVAKAGSQVSKFFGSIKGFGGKKTVEESVAAVENIAEEAVEEVQAQVSHAAKVAEDLVGEAQEASQVSRFFGSMKNLGSGKKPSAEEIVTKVEQETKVAVETVEEVAVEAAGKMSKLKGMLSFKKTPAKAEVDKAKLETVLTAEPEALLDSMVEKLEASEVNKLIPKKLKDIYHKIMSV